MTEAGKRLISSALQARAKAREDNVVENSGNYLAAVKAMKRKDYEAAIACLNAEMAFYLYKMMWGIDSIRPIQTLRFECYRQLRAGR